MNVHASTQKDQSRILIHQRCIANQEWALAEAFSIARKTASKEIEAVFKKCAVETGHSIAEIESFALNFKLLGTVPDYVLQCASAAITKKQKN